MKSMLIVFDLDEQARDTQAVLDAAQNGLNIIFNVSRVFYFLLDEKLSILTGYCSAGDKSYKIIKSIALPMSNPASILVRCVKEQKQFHTLTKDMELPMAISDKQIIRLIKSPGLYCIPISSSDKSLGVMALGVKDRNLLFAKESIKNPFSK